MTHLPAVVEVADFAVAVDFMGRVPVVFTAVAALTWPLPDDFDRRIQ
jgi:hypothetical protein